MSFSIWDILSEDERKRITDRLKVYPAQSTDGKNAGVHTDTKSNS